MHYIRTPSSTPFTIAVVILPSQLVDVDHGTKHAGALVVRNAREKFVSLVCLSSRPNFAVFPRRLASAERPSSVDTGATEYGHRISATSTRRSRYHLLGTFTHTHTFVWRRRYDVGSNAERGKLRPATRMRIIQHTTTACVSKCSAVCTSLRTCVKQTTAPTEHTHSRPYDHCSAGLLHHFKCIR